MLTRLMLLFLLWRMTARLGTWSTTTHWNAGRRQAGARGGHLDLPSARAGPMSALRASLVSTVTAASSFCSVSVGQAPRLAPAPHTPSPLRDQGPLQAHELLQESGTPGTHEEILGPTAQVQTIYRFRRAGCIRHSAAFRRVLPSSPDNTDLCRRCLASARAAYRVLVHRSYRGAPVCSSRKGAAAARARSPFLTLLLKSLDPLTCLFCLQTPRAAGRAKR
jgi:hypothetical protein